MAMLLAYTQIGLIGLWEVMEHRLTATMAALSVLLDIEINKR